MNTISAVLLIGALAITLIAAAGVTALSIASNIRYARKEHPIFALGAVFGGLFPLLYLCSPMFFRTVGTVISAFAQTGNDTMLSAISAILPCVLTVIAAAVSCTLPGVLFAAAGLALKTDKTGDWLTKIILVNVIAVLIAAITWKISPYELNATILSFNESLGAFLQFTIPLNDNLPFGWEVFSIGSLCPFLIFGYSLLSAGCSITYAIAKKRNIAFFVIGAVLSLVLPVLFLIPDVTKLAFSFKVLPDAETDGLISSLLTLIPAIGADIREMILEWSAYLENAVPALASVFGFVSNLLSDCLGIITDFGYNDLIARKTFGFLYEISGFTLTALPGTFLFLFGYYLRNPEKSKTGSKLALLCVAAVLISILAVLFGVLAWTEMGTALYQSIAAWIVRLFS